MYFVEQPSWIIDDQTITLLNIERAFLSGLFFLADIFERPFLSDFFFFFERAFLLAKWTCLLCLYSTDNMPQSYFVLFRFLPIYKIQFSFVKSKVLYNKVNIITYECNNYISCILLFSYWFFLVMRNIFLNIWEGDVK